MAATAGGNDVPSSSELSSLSVTDEDGIAPYHPLRIHRNISLPAEFADAHEIKSMSDIENVKNNVDRWKLKLQIFFLSKSFQTWLMALIALDLACVLADLIILLVYCELDEHEPHGVEIVIEIIEILSIIILIVFEFEFMLQIWVFGQKWFHNFVHIFDVVIVTSTLMLEIIFFSNEEVETIVGLLVLLRLWRLFRVVYVTAEALELKIEEKHKEGHEKEKRIRELESTIREMNNNHNSNNK